MPSFRIVSLVLVLTFFLSHPLSATGHSLIQQRTDAFEPADCPFENPFFSFITPESQGFECGYVTVPEQHADPDGPTIRLPVAILKASGDNPQPDPLFLAQGGPGGDAFGVFSTILPNTNLARDRDLVIFNQRGTLYADPQLACTELNDILAELLVAPRDKADELTKNAYTQCHERFQAEGINLSAYNSVENAADIEAIRAALGYDTFNFYGVSYGTLLGLHLMRDHPEHLRSVILDAVVPPQLNFIPLVPQNTNRLFDQFFQACAADETCQAEYPDLETRFFAVVDQLNEQPTTLTIADPDTGQHYDVRLDGDTLLGFVYQIAYLPEAYAIFPNMVKSFEAGDYRFIEVILPLFLFDDTISDGMYFSVICAEDADFDPEATPLAGLRPQIAANAVEDLKNSYIDMCAIWQVDALGPFIDEPVVSDIPTLLLSGEFDPITPPENAAAAAASLTNSFNYVDAVGSHGAFGSDACANQIVEAFLNNPTVPPNASCLTQASPDNFVPPNTIRVDLIHQINTLDPWAVAFTLLAGLFLLGILSAFVVWPIVLVVRLITQRKIETESRLLRWTRSGLVIVFGLLALVFVVGLNIFIVQSLSGSMAILSVVSSWAAPLFIVPYLLALLALGIIALMIWSWQKKEGTIWSRLYYTFLTLCVIGYISMLAFTGMFSVLI
ncbi:MAG: alpha/beta fold hydrolase [Anaerolineae bacterium]|nr:alpha/beta fold hydrolase [Anaerolineae bacterium]